MTMKKQEQATEYILVENGYDMPLPLNEMAFSEIYKTSEHDVFYNIINPDDGHNLLENFYYEQGVFSERSYDSGVRQFVILMKQGNTIIGKMTLSINHSDLSKILYLKVIDIHVAYHNKGNARKMYDFLLKNIQNEFILVRNLNKMNKENKHKILKLCQSHFVFVYDDENSHHVQLLESFKKEQHSYQDMVLKINNLNQDKEKL